MSFGILGELMEELKKNMPELMLILSNNFTFKLKDINKYIISNIEEFEPNLTKKLSDSLRSNYSNEEIENLLHKSKEENWPEFFKDKKKRKKNNFQNEYNLKLESIFHYYNKKEITTDYLKSAFAFFICTKYFKVDYYFALLAKSEETNDEFIVWLKMPFSFNLRGCCFPCLL